MGRGGKWFVAVNRAFICKSKGRKKTRKKNNSKRIWGFGRCSDFGTNSSKDASQGVVKNDKGKHAVGLEKAMRFNGKSEEEVAAIMIQTAVRGYLARRALLTLRQFVRLRSKTNRDEVKRQTAAALSFMQTQARIQVQISTRRSKMFKEKQALQHQLKLKHERELQKLKMAEEWDDSHRSKEQVEAHMQNKQEAATRRERALAYAFSHQWKNSSRLSNPTFLDPNNLQWGWSWMERSMAVKPLENCYVAGGSKNKVCTYSPSTPLSKNLSMAGKIKLASPRSCRRAQAEDDLHSIQSDRPRRHSVAGSSVKDGKNVLATTTPVPNYMLPTKSAIAKSRNRTPSINKTDTSDWSSVSSARKRLSFPLADNGGNG